MGDLIILVLDLLANTLPWMLPEKSRLERNIIRLKKEQWFRSIYDRDFLVHLERTPELRKFLKKRRNVKILLKNPYERESFLKEIEPYLEVSGTKKNP